MNLGIKEGDTILIEAKDSGEKEEKETSSTNKTLNQYQKIIQQLKKINPDLKLLGLTATPYRLGMGWIYRKHDRGISRSEDPRPFERCIYELPLRYLIKRQYLTQPTLVDATIEHYNFSNLNASQNGEYNSQEINSLLGKYHRVTQGIVEHIIELSQDRQGIMIFAATVDHAKEIIGYLPQNQSALVIGSTDNKDRDQLIEQFKRKDIKYLVNVSVLTTGFDAPHVDMIAILRPTQSVSLYQQIIGRGLRLSDNKKDCLVIDYSGNSFDLYQPEVGEKKPNSDAKPVQVICPSCEFANIFWGLIDNEGHIIEHYGRRCQGLTNDQQCDYRFVFKECRHCGQENDTRRLTFGHFITESLNNFLSFDGRFFHTLKDLITTPGKVPQAYTEGKRMRYMDPTKIYFLVSIILLTFVEFKKTDSQSILQKPLITTGTNSSESTTSPNAPVFSDYVGLLEDTANYAVRFSAFTTFYQTYPQAPELAALDSLHFEANFQNRFIDHQASKMAHFNGKDFRNYFFSKLFWVLFLFLPITALFLKILYIRRPLYYPEHLIFTFYNQSVFFILWGITLPFYDTLIPAGLVSAAYAVYLLFAMKRFYKQGFGKTLLKFTLLNLVSIPAFMIFFFLSLFVVFFIF